MSGDSLTGAVLRICAEMGIDPAAPMTTVQLDDFRPKFAAAISGRTVAAPESFEFSMSGDLTMTKEEIADFQAAMDEAFANRPATPAVLWPHILCDEVLQVTSDGVTGLVHVRADSNLSPPAGVPSLLGRALADVVTDLCYPPSQGGGHD